MGPCRGWLGHSGSAPFNENGASIWAPQNFVILPPLRMTQGLGDHLWIFPVLVSEILASRTAGNTVLLLVSYPQWYLLFKHPEWPKRDCNRRGRQSVDTVVCQEHETCGVKKAVIWRLWQWVRSHASAARCAMLSGPALDVLLLTPQWYLTGNVNCSFFQRPEELSTSV